MENRFLNSSLFMPISFFKASNLVGLGSIVPFGSPTNEPDPWKGSGSAWSGSGRVWYGVEKLWLGLGVSGWIVLLGVW